MESLCGRTLVEADPDLGGGAEAPAAPSVLSPLAVPAAAGALFPLNGVEGVVLSIWTAASSALDRGQKVVHRGLVSPAVCGKRGK